MSLSSSTNALFPVRIFVIRDVAVGSCMLMVFFDFRFQPANLFITYTSSVTSSDVFFPDEKLTVYVSSADTILDEPNRTKNSMPVRKSQKPNLYFFCVLLRITLPFPRSLKRGVITSRNNPPLVLSNFQVQLSVYHRLFGIFVAVICQIDYCVITHYIVFSCFIAFPSFFVYKVFMKLLYALAGLSPCYCFSGHKKRAHQSSLTGIPVFVYSVLDARPPRNIQLEM